MLVYGKYKCFVMQKLYVCVRPVAVLNATFCMTCSLIMQVDNAMGDHLEELYYIAAFILCRRLCACTEML